MQSTNVINRKALRDVLQSLHVLTDLGKSELASLEIVREKIPDISTATPVQLGLALKSELQSALEELKQTYQLASGEERTFYTLLFERYVGRRSAAAVAPSLNIERTEFYRRLTAALDALASILNARELRLRGSRAKTEDTSGLPGETRPIFQVPLPMVDQLVGRDRLYRAMKEGLTRGRMTVLLGIPGIGKTSLALSLAYDPDVRQRFSDGVLWANLGTTPNPLATLKQWGYELGVSVDVINSATLEDLARRVHERIGLKSLLIIIDDAWDINTAMLLRVGGIHCQHVVTTRLLEVAIALADANGPLRIEELALDESITLLSNYVDERTLLGFGISLESLAKTSGGLPLSLMLTGRLLSQAMHSGMGRRFQTLLQALQNPTERMKLSLPVGPNDAGGSMGGHLSVFTQIAATEQVLSDEARGALPYLGVFLPKPHTFSADAALAVCDCSVEAIDELVALGLLETRSGDRYSLHQSISDYARSRLSDDGAWLRLARWYADYATANETNYIALDAEWDNIQHVLNIARQRNYVTELLRASHALASFLLSRNMSERAYNLLSDTLESCRQVGTPAMLARHLVLLAQTALHAKALEPAGRAIHEALQLCSQNKDASHLLPRAYEIAAMVADATGKTEEALQWYGHALESAQITRQVHVIPRMLVNMERLDIDNPNHRQIVASAMKQPPMWQKVISKAQTLLLIQTKLLSSNAFRLWVTGVRLIVKGETEDGIMALRQAAGEARAAGDPAALITALGFYSLVCIGIGDYVTAERCAAEGLPLKASVVFPRSVGFLYSSSAWSHLYRGDVTRANALLNEGLAYSKANGHVESEAWLKGVMSVAWIAQGDANAAYQSAFDSVAQSQRSGVVDMLSYSTAMCGLALAHLRDYDKAWQYLKESVTDVSAFSDVWGRTFGWLCYGEGLLMAGNMDASRDSLTQGYDLATKIGAIPHVARAQFGLAKVALAEGNRSAAQEYANQSYQYFTRLGDVRAQEVSWWVRDQLGGVMSDK